MEEFDFALPERLIALRPAVPRDAARMLCVAGAARDDRHVRDLPDLLRPGDLLVVNDSRVIPARFAAVRAPRTAPAHLGAAGLIGARVEVTLHTRLGPNTWAALIKGAKKLEIGDRLTLSGALGARVAAKADGGEAVLAFELEGPALDAAIAAHGTTPLPPYIASRRPADARDSADYQTVYARQDGSVAAPTAGLHVTPGLLARLAARGIATVAVTLHVGPGTFLPVKAADPHDHQMHAEWGEVSPATAAAVNAGRAAGGRIVAVGTTTLRLLETAIDAQGRLAPFCGMTDIFITPGHRVRAADLLLTNFHLPRSTLFMLVCAFAGIGAMRDAYAHAIAQDYRFYSYGDATLLTRSPG